MSGVTVIVPNWNRRDLVERLIDRLRDQTLPPERILVVDNGSTDGSAEAVKAKGAEVIALERNIGFAGAVNLGIRETRTEWIAIVNNDVEPAADWLERLMKAAGQSSVWFATGKLVNAARPESLDGTYDVVCRGACAWRAGHGRPDGPLWNTPRRIRIAPFTAALFRAELFQRAGLLDERFESYIEDVDFGLRSAASGYGGVYSPDAVASHAGSSTLGAWHPETVRRMARNQVLLIAKHYPLRYFFRYGWQIAVAQVLWGALALRHGCGLPFLMGKWEGIKLFRTVRREARGARHKGLSKILTEGESEIFRIQRRTGFDLYWRLYFAFTSLT
ncbi:MAG: glycosyltransferase family 2 protein [Bryobacteraceae bacterium]